MGNEGNRRMHIFTLANCFVVLCLLCTKLAADDVGVAVAPNCLKPEFYQTIGQLSEEQLRESYGQPACGNAEDPSDDDTKPKILNGKEAIANSLPWMASLSTEESGHFCGGVLLNKRFVVTAKSCLIDITTNTETPPNEVKVRLGTNFLEKQPDPNAQVLQVQSYVHHPEGDISVIRLASDANLNPFVWPIWFKPGSKTRKNPLFGPNIDADAPEAGEAVIAGWGKITGGRTALAKASNTLLTATVGLRHDKVCEDVYQGQPHAYNHLWMICAGGKCTNPTVGTNCEVAETCQGDAGGPLMYLNADKHYIFLGVTSFGSGCARSAAPGVYTFVYRARDWLEAQIRIQ